MRDVSRTVDAGNRDAFCMKVDGYQVERRIIGRPREDEIMRRRHQNDSRDLITIFNRRHQRRLSTPLLTRSKPIEQPQDQAMLSLAPQEKRLNAFEKLSGI